MGYKDLKAVKEEIKKHVSLKDILIESGKINGILPEEQFSCTFHGADFKKSARYYEESDTCHCFTCHKSWDLYSYLQQRDTLTFKQTLNYLLKTYRIDISKLPDAISTNTNLRKQNKQGYDNKKLFLFKVKDMISSFENKIPAEKYIRLVYAYMVIKYSFKEENEFLENALKLKRAVEKISKEI